MLLSDRAKEFGLSSGRSFLLFGVDATRLHTGAWSRARFCSTGLTQIKTHVQCIAWNFPFTGEDENEVAHRELILAFFRSLACWCTGASKMLTAVLMLQGDQFSRWHVLRAAQSCFFVLESWNEFDWTEFPGYVPSRSSGEPFPVQGAMMYIFHFTNIG